MSVRIWTRTDTRRFAIPFIKALVKKGHKVSNFDNYGLDGSSYRFDIRYRIENWKLTYLKDIHNLKKWKNEILKLEVDEWKEPDLVKTGHDIATLLALRYSDYRKLPIESITIAHFVGYILQRQRVNLKIPEWHREFNAKKFKMAYNYVMKGIKIQPNFTILDRVIHNFLNNLGVSDSGESFVWNCLVRWWWLTQLEPRVK